MSAGRSRIREATIAMLALLAIATGCRARGEPETTPTGRPRGDAAAPMQCTGTHAAYLVFPGCGRGEADWAAFLAAARAPVCTIASTSYCEPRPRSTTPRDVVLSIERAWETGMLETSVTAIGHSWGGLLLQVAVAHMPRRFARVVLLDATARGFLVEPSEDRPILAREGWDVDRSVRELDEARRAWPQRLPTFVFVHDADAALRSGGESRESQALWDADRALLGRLSPATEVSSVAGTTHDLPRELGRALADRLAPAATVHPPPATTP